ncbi:MAG: SRPBCC domain-containing protein [Caulobacteraceae bacterium]
MSSRVLVALRVKASAERAFEAFTKEISAWWKPNGLFAFTPRDPGLLSFEPGPDGRLIETLKSGKVFEIGKITRWSPPHRLAFSWRQASFSPDQTTQVDIRFDEVGEETRITVEHTGWEAIPQSHAARHGFPLDLFLTRHGEWWRALLESLSNRLDLRESRPGR